LVIWVENFTDQSGLGADVDVIGGNDSGSGNERYRFQLGRFRLVSGSGGFLGGSFFLAVVFAFAGALVGASIAGIAGIVGSADGAVMGVGAGGGAARRRGSWSCPARAGWWKCRCRKTIQSFFFS